MKNFENGEMKGKGGEERAWLKPAAASIFRMRAESATLPRIKRHPH